MKRASSILPFISTKMGSISKSPSSLGCRETRLEVKKNKRLVVGKPVNCRFSFFSKPLNRSAANQVERQPRCMDYGKKFIAEIISQKPYCDLNHVTLLGWLSTTWGYVRSFRWWMSVIMLLVFWIPASGWLTPGGCNQSGNCPQVFYWLVSNLRLLDTDILRPSILVKWICVCV